MPRRRLSERQTQRIQKIQERRRQRLDQLTKLSLAEITEIPPEQGLVCVRHGANLAVEDAKGEMHHCLPRRNIGHPVCGDQVVWQEVAPAQGVVTAILPRTSVLSRPDYSGRDKPLAANVHQLAILLATVPAPSAYLLDQYLVTAALSGIRPLVIFNKVDLLGPDELAAMRARFAHYGALGHPLIWLSLRDPATLPPLLERLTGQTSILVGQSGVGKSSLARTLLPDREIQIGRLSRVTGFGRHTTSATTCYRLPDGGRLIDSPGVRSFRLGTITLSDLLQGFPEVALYQGRCRFRDCRHAREPGCAVREAVELGEIHPTRLANFRHLAAGP
jgi:ribosome biogenesis GTPase / thiamine phosphate phosphatase